MSNYFANLKDFEWIRRQTQKTLKALETQIANIYVQTYKANLIKIKEFYTQYANSYGRVSYAKVIQYHRLEKLNKEIKKVLMKMYRQNNSLIINNISDNMKLSFNGVGWATQNALNSNIGWTFINEKAIQLAINNPISGLTLSELLEFQRDSIIKKIKQTVVRGIVNGSNYQVMAKELKPVFDGDYKKAMRVVRTEEHRCVETARQLGYDDVIGQGIDSKKRWLATLDNKTRDSHAMLDGTEVPTDEPFISELGNSAQYPGGFGVAEEDINCRCTTVMVYNETEKTERHSRIDGETEGKYIPYMKYSDWAKTKGL